MNFNSITFARFYPHTDAQHLPGLIECYRDVFADPPWNEWRRCSVCSKYWGKNDAALLESLGYVHCGKPLVEYWSAEGVERDIRHEVTPDASCWLAFHSGKIVGFCWGYPISLDALERKLGLSLTELRKDVVDEGHQIAYQDEVGVISSFRGRKIAKEMFKRRLGDFWKKGLRIGVVRTRELPVPSVTFSWFVQRLGYRVVARYPVNDGRVVLARELDGLSGFS